MASATIQQAKVIENSSAVLMARIVRDDGSPITPDEVLSLTCNVYDADDESLTSSPELTPEDNLFETLQKNAAWTVDSTGFNFSASLSGDNWPKGGRLVQVEVKVTPMGDDPYVSGSFYIVWQLQTLNILSE